MAKKKVAKKKIKVDAPSFEESLAELETIVGKLEGGQLPLSDSLAAYELGVKRVQGCYAQLEDAERRIELVTAVDNQGNATTEDFDEGEAADLTGKSQQRTRRSTTKRAPRDESGDSLF
ncbi:exodeoxyribonuclease VII small subunit [Adhaeretor mobilis]|uniref:Exodeoxyribonuclease 7 small subunit n=1 Tax=Adhaeretor mobilis TaxID=1930276 RepID=A0A517N048_9BACT|nr:exodeoxyribonuclease VII small subunit [Adhaeretor mobilis]QDT00506.1 Exodeoxyribonuclease 7 small subunit [Adhaeretor mobilis]